MQLNSHCVRHTHAHALLCGLEMSRLAEFGVHLRGCDYYSPVQTARAHMHSRSGTITKRSHSSLEGLGRAGDSSSVKAAVDDSAQRGLTLPRAPFDPHLCLLSVHSTHCSACYIHTRATSSVHFNDHCKDIVKDVVSLMVCVLAKNGTLCSFPRCPKVFVGYL